MTAGYLFPIPPDRVLSSWRHALTAFQPRRLWLAQLLLHRVEALVRVSACCEVEPVRLALLRQVAEAAPLDQLRVDRDILARWLQELAADGLIEPDGTQRLTERGRRSLESGHYTATVEERRSFHLFGRRRSQSSASLCAFPGTRRCADSAAGMAVRCGDAGSVCPTTCGVEDAAWFPNGCPSRPRTN